MSNKKIVFVAIDNGIDGMQPDNILYASYNENDVKALHSKDKSKQWRRLSEKIVDIDQARAKALSKLDGIDRLVLGLPNWIETK